jgi:hypothetical protein
VIRTGNVAADVDWSISPVDHQLKGSSDLESKVVQFDDVISRVSPATAFSCGATLKPVQFAVNECCVLAKLFSLGTAVIPAKTSTAIVSALILDFQERAGE